MIFPSVSRDECSYDISGLSNKNHEMSTSSPYGRCDAVGVYEHLHNTSMEQRPPNSGAGQVANMYSPMHQYCYPRAHRQGRVGSKLFVGQVPAVATEKQLRPVFEPYGELLEVKIMRDAMGRSKGSAWVRYQTDEMALRAIYALHEKHTVPPQTNPLRVQFATPSKTRCQSQQANALNLAMPTDQTPREDQQIGVPLRFGTYGNALSQTPSNNVGGYTLSPSAHQRTVSLTGSGSYTSSTNRVGVDCNQGKQGSFCVEDTPYVTTSKSFQPQCVGYSPLTNPSSNAFNQRVHPQKSSEINSNKRESCPQLAWPLGTDENEHIEGLRRVTSATRSGGVSFASGKLCWEDGR